MCSGYHQRIHHNWTILCEGNRPVTGGFPSQRPITLDVVPYHHVIKYKYFTTSWPPARWAIASLVATGSLMLYMYKSKFFFLCICTVRNKVTTTTLATYNKEECIDNISVHLLMQYFIDLAINGNRIWILDKPLTGDSMSRRFEGSLITCWSFNKITWCFLGLIVRDKAPHKSHVIVSRLAVVLYSLISSIPLSTGTGKHTITAVLVKPSERMWIPLRSDNKSTNSKTLILGYYEYSILKSMWVKNNFRNWLMIHWWQSRQPMESHVRKTINQHTCQYGFVSVTKAKGSLFVICTNFNPGWISNHTPSQGWCVNTYRLKILLATLKLWNGWGSSPRTLWCMLILIHAKMLESNPC